MTRVLLLDSDSDTAEMYSIGLQMEGFSASIARDSAAALAHIREGYPEALVAEVSEAARNDWQIVRQCRDAADGRGVPVVLLTGHPPAAIPPTAARLGCATLMKPCLPETLAEVIRALLARGED